MHTSLLGIVAQCKASSFLPINRNREQSSLEHSGEIIGPLMQIRIVLFDQLQCLSELKHCCKLVFAVVATEAGTGQIADLAIAVFELHLVGFAAFNDFSFCLWLPEEDLSATHTGFDVNVVLRHHSQDRVDDTTLISCVG